MVKLISAPTSPEMWPSSEDLYLHRGDYGEVYVGSSNISKSGLVDGIEWNYA